MLYMLLYYMWVPTTSRTTRQKKWCNPSATLVKESGAAKQCRFDSIITRNDDPSLATKVTKCNKLLNDLCIEQNWSVIDNNNIHKYQLSNYGLHLNTKGSASLAKNIKNYLKNDN